MRIVLLGLPGAGKGTQAEKLKNRLNLPHISTGNLLRETVKKETSLSNKIKSFLDRGELVPYSIILRLLREIIKEKEKFILDGFPRNLLQAEELDVILGEENKKLDLG
ncbi:MAG: nucleoside monophosphate kinase, partial [Candidatus Aerophobetes bacterium]|nr:nucleoside monophosphate kinase [Candidatus Aerophobetes bacterium]